MQNQPKYVAEIKLDGVFSEFVESLREIERDAIALLHSLEEAREGPVPHMLQGVDFNMQLSEPPAITPQTKEHSRSWLCAIAISNAIDAFGIYCEDVFRAIQLSALFASGKAVVRKPVDSNSEISLRTIADCILQEKTLWSFDRLGVPKKLDELRQYVGVLNYDLELRSIQAARNCLTHRSGWVEQDDLKDSPDGFFNVRYRQTRLLIKREGMMPQPVQIGMIIEAGSSLHVEWGIHAVAAFRKGERVRFSIQQLYDILHTVFWAGHDLHQRSVKLLVPDSTGPSGLGDASANTAVTP